MDCKIVLRNHTSLQCMTHDSDSMSAICEVAERTLRDRIDYLEHEIAEQRLRLQVLQASLRGPGLP